MHLSLSIETQQNYMEDFQSSSSNNLDELWGSSFASGSRTHRTQVEAFPFLHNNIIYSKYFLSSDNNNFISGLFLQVAAMQPSNCFPLPPTTATVCSGSFSSFSPKYY